MKAVSAACTTYSKIETFPLKSQKCFCSVLFFYCIVLLTFFPSPARIYNQDFTLQNVVDRWTDLWEFAA